MVNVFGILDSFHCSSDVVQLGVKFIVAVDTLASRMEGYRDQG